MNKDDKEFLAVKSGNEEEEECNGDAIRIPVFEKHVDIGELYDARTDFLHIGERLWEADPEKSNVKISQQAVPRA